MPFFPTSQTPHLFRPFQGFQHPRTWAECTSTRCEAQQKTITINNVSHRVFLALLEHLGPRRTKRLLSRIRYFGDFSVFGVRFGDVHLNHTYIYIYIYLFFIDTYILGSIKLTVYAS